MRAFAAGETDVLVATTVIEVGIDVANATVMVIEGAERFGVSQLHQLRGRVGRGEHPSQCLLFAEEAGELARRRLRGGGEGARRLQARRGRPRRCAARARSSAPARAACRASRSPACPRTRRPCSRRARRCWRCCARHGSLADPALGPAARRRPPPLRRRRRRPDPPLASGAVVELCRPWRDKFAHSLGRHAGDRRRAEGAAAGRAARLEGAADLRPRPRGDLLGARRSGSRAPPSSTSTAAPAPWRSRRSRAAPRAPSSSTATPARRSATSSGSASGAGRAGPRRRRPLAGAGFRAAGNGEVRPRLRRRPL